MSAAIVWFRRDLRLADNPALVAAARSGLPVIPLYIHSPGDEGDWAAGAASNAWLHRSLRALNRRLLGLGSRLLIRAGSARDVLPTLVRETGAQVVAWNARIEPLLAARDRALADALRRDGIEVHVGNASLLIDPDRMRTGSGAPYRVFTPFWRSLSPRLPDAPPSPVPALPAPSSWPTDVALNDLGLRARPRWDREFWTEWEPGERGALRRIEAICDQVGRYGELRNRPDVEGTSRLSPHLHFGEIGPRQVVWALVRRGLAGAGEAFLRELGWREFSQHLLIHNPDTPERALDRSYEHFPWRIVDPDTLADWQQGRTGIPMVDAGMRQLWRTGWMHNRVRMVVASYLTKNLRYHWLHGARWFWQTLVDADLANNTQGWQWTAGCGADAAPYFRVFNPVSQGERFDPAGHYVRQFLPELARVPDKFVHAPWLLPAAERRLLELDSTPYGAPRIDLAATRAEAIAAWQGMRAARHPD